VRVDAGFLSGDRVPESYDSLLGKVISWGADREQAAARLAEALQRTYCAGVHTNEHWLARILKESRFLQVRHSIAFLDQAALQALEPRAPSTAALSLAALVATEKPPPALASPWDLADAFTPNLPASVLLRLSWRADVRTVQLLYEAGRVAGVCVDGGPVLPVSEVVRSAGDISACVGAERFSARCLRERGRVHLWVSGEHYEFLIDDPREREFSASAATGGLTTPLPGVVVSVPVTIGQQVEAGAVLMVIEAMKMEHAITAPYAGSVTAIHFAPGERVPEASPLLELARSAAP
jgi:3-methylcrotonyl-CoA carboxylase alpha subunit